MDCECPICASTDTAGIAKQPRDYEYNVKTGREFHVRCCASCGSHFLYPRPTTEEIIDFYPDDYHAYNEDHGGLARFLVERRDKTRRKLYLSLTSNRPVALFDVGSGDCRQFEALGKYGEFTFAGVEISPLMVEKTRNKNYAVQQGTLETLDISGIEESFDIVTMYQLVEHVLDPALLFRKARRLLRPGGYVIGQLPCLASMEAALAGRYWAGYHFPRHLQQFTKKSLKALIEKEGFAEAAVSTALHLQAALSLQNRVVAGAPSRHPLKYGKIAAYPLLLLMVAPFCLFEYACARGGMMNFIARRPL